MSSASEGTLPSKRTTRVVEPRRLHTDFNGFEAVRPLWVPVSGVVLVNVDHRPEQHGGGLHSLSHCPAAKTRPTGQVPNYDLPMADHRFESVAEVRQKLHDVAYLADDGIAGVVHLADRLQKPILVEGPAGTGKTQLAKSVAEMTGARLIRLQCYEGLDEAKALYEWNYKKQLLRIQAQRNAEDGAARGRTSKRTSSARTSS